jgi:hypothetical protein
VYSARAKGEGVCNRAIQSDIDFEIDVVIIAGIEGLKIKTRFFLGLGVPTSDQSMEIVIFG